MRYLPWIQILAFLLAGQPNVVHAQWPFGGVAITTAVDNQSRPLMVSDGSGGAVIVWSDNRAGTNMDVYAGRVNALGVTQWTANGVAICTAAQNQIDPVIASDGAGGAVIAWSDRRNSDWNAYVQRIDASGASQWTSNGVALCAVSGIQAVTAIVADGSGGAFVVWRDERDATDRDVYAQRIDGAGNVLWTTDGIPVCAQEDEQLHSEMMSDGAGGIMVVWKDNRSGANAHLYMQRIDGAGNALWTTDGVLVSDASWVDMPALIMDGSGGAVIAWQDGRNGNPDVYAQRVDAAGVSQWTADGVALCTATGPQFDIVIGPDGSGGGVVVWTDGRAGDDIYAQRVDGTGSAVWASDGVAICTAPGFQSRPAVLADGAGGAIVTWQDARVFDHDIYTQQVDANGVLQWLAGGIPVCSALHDQVDPAIVSDGDVGAIVAWTDARGSDRDIYALQFDGVYGTDAGDAPRAGALALQSYPNPFAESTELEIGLSQKTDVTIEIFDVAGRRVRVFDVAGAESSQRVRLEGVDQQGRPLGSGVYFVRVTAGRETATHKVVITR